MGTRIHIGPGTSQRRGVGTLERWNISVRAFAHLRMHAFTHLRIYALTLFLLLFISTSAAVAQDEQWLQYRSAGEARQIVGDMSYQYLDPKPDKPADVNLPQFASDKPLFLPWQTPMAKSGTVWLAFDQSTAEGAYDRLYIDADADGDLSDETASELTRRESYRTFFGPAKIVFDTEDGPITYHLAIELYSQPDRTYCLLSPACWYEGPIMVAGVKKHCTLIDYNANGVFNDKSSDFSRSDRIRIGAQNNRDTRFVGNYIEVDDKLYRPEIARDGAFIILTEAADVPYSTVRMADNITTLAAGGENGLFVRKPENGAVKLPVGDYRIDYWSIVKNDDKGSRWELRGRYSGGGAFTVTQDKDIDLSIGEPIYSQATIQLSGSSFLFGQSLQGRQGERIELLRNGSQPPPPKLRIRNKDATYDRALSFEYG